MRTIYFYPILDAPSHKDWSITEKVTYMPKCYSKMV
jgi:hypothetical protein